MKHKKPPVQYGAIGLTPVRLGGTLFNESNVTLKLLFVYLPYLDSEPDGKQAERDTSGVHPETLPPAELARHFHLDGVGHRHAVRLADVCRVVDGAVAPPGVPTLDEHGVTLVADVD